MTELTEELNDQITDRVIALVAGAAALEDGPVPDSLDDISEGGAFFIPVLIPEETESGDGRTFTKGSLSHRDLPLPLLWQIKTDDGHDGSVIVGRIDTCDIEEGVGITNARGVFDTGPFGREAERLVRQKMLRGVSADLDKFEANVRDDDAAEAADDSEDPAGRGKIKNDKVTVTQGRVMAATLVPKPAFQECAIMMDDQTDEPMLIEDGLYEEESPESDAIVASLAALAASAAPVHPPKSWFSDPELNKPTPLTVTDDGRVFGHIAAWHVRHIGLPGATKPPRSASNYAYFKTGVLRTEEGEDVSVGQLTLAGGHAPLYADAASAVKHYDDTASAVADVTAGEDAHGIWVAGALRPGVTPEQVRTLRASAPSGDWRPIQNRLELVAVCQVNVPGFPVARSMVASGKVTALVAAGAQYLAALRDEPMRELEDRIKTIEQLELSRAREAALARLRPLADERNAALVASANAARDRIQSLRSEREALIASAEAARQRISEFKTSSGLHVAPDFKEELHPRDDSGKFRDVLFKLKDALHAMDGADDATRSIDSAVERADGGNMQAARDSAVQAKAQLEDAARSAIDDESRAKLSEIGDQLDNALQAAGEHLTDEGHGMAFADLPEDFQQWIEQIVQQGLENVDPTQPAQAAVNRLDDWIKGQGFQSPQEIASLVERFLRERITPQ